MKLMKTTEAVGQVLCHDITQIIPGVKKDAVFRKGHIITKEDIPVLLSVGKDTIYIWENDETMMHENEAAEVLYRMSACGTKKIEADTQSGVSCGTKQHRYVLFCYDMPLAKNCILFHAGNNLCDIV